MILYGLCFSCIYSEIENMLPVVDVKEQSDLYMQKQKTGQPSQL